MKHTFHFCLAIALHLLCGIACSVNLAYASTELNSERLSPKDTNGLIATPKTAKTFKIAVIAKTKNAFFDEVHKGCLQAQSDLQHVECVYTAPNIADVTLQDSLISRLIDDEVDGIAVSVLQSKYLSEKSLLKAQQRGIPVITFDSDLDRQTLDKYPHLRLAYVGTNNIAFGQAIAQHLQQLYPDGGVICILSGRPDSSNMMQRMLGLRSELSGDYSTREPGKRLKHSRGWTEFERCPMYNYEDQTVALQQLSIIASQEQNYIDAIISLGGWAQFDQDNFKKALAPIKQKIEDNKTHMLFADTLSEQIELLDQGYSSANIGQAPFEIGRQAVHKLYSILHNETYEYMTHTPITLCTRRSEPRADLSLSHCVPQAAVMTSQKPKPARRHHPLDHQ